MVVIDLLSRPSSAVPEDVQRMLDGFLHPVMSQRGKFGWNLARLTSFSITSRSPCDGRAPTDALPREVWRPGRRPDRTSAKSDLAPSRIATVRPSGRPETHLRAQGTPGSADSLGGGKTPEVASRPEHFLGIFSIANFHLVLFATPGRPPRGRLPASMNASRKRPNSQLRAGEIRALTGVVTWLMLVKYSLHGWRMFAKWKTELWLIKDQN
jgi:hypothetical protein